MEKKVGLKELLLLIVALIFFVAAVIGIYKWPQVVTAICFVVETVVFLTIIMISHGKTSKTSVAEEENEEDTQKPKEEVSTDSGLGLFDGGPETPEKEETESITVVSAPEDAAVGSGVEKEDEEKPVKEITKLKTVLFDETLLEEKETVDMGEVVKETIDVMEPFSSAAGIKTGYVCSGDVKYLASKKLMSVMMKNIVDNAVKYMRRSGNMHVTVSNVADDIFIVCKDDGLGIGKDELPYIFDLNFQGSNRVSGNGLGLTQARDIVNAYGGTIYAKSAPGAGMGIYIQLPSVREANEI